jgi:predicted RNase H-like HicB family nuclease
MNYKVVITHDIEYDGYVVDVPELYGCMSQGKTLDEAMANIKEAIILWLEVENGLGRTNERANISDMFIGDLTI